MKGANERLLYEILNESYPGEWQSDVTFLEGRRYRGDAVNTKRKIVIEINGGTHPFYITLKNGKKVLAEKGGHSSPEGIERDYEKNNALVVGGWKLLIYTPNQLRKTPFMLISAVRQLCGYVDNAQTTLSLDGMTQTKLKEQLQVKLS